eukprot:5665898-Pleurochrysis_carterae.AAC.1
MSSKHRLRMLLARSPPRMPRVACSVTSCVPQWPACATMPLHVQTWRTVDVPTVATRLNSFISDADGGVFDEVRWQINKVLKALEAKCGKRKAAPTGNANSKRLATNEKKAAAPSESTPAAAAAAADKTASPTSSGQGSSQPNQSSSNKARTEQVNGVKDAVSTSISDEVPADPTIRENNNSKVPEVATEESAKEAKRRHREEKEAKRKARSAIAAKQRENNDSAPLRCLRP